MSKEYRLFLVFKGIHILCFLLFLTLSAAIVYYWEYLPFWLIVILSMISFMMSEGVTGLFTSFEDFKNPIEQQQKERQGNPASVCWVALSGRVCKLRFGFVEEAEVRSRI